MEPICSGFEHLSFHDTSIDNIVRGPSTVLIEFSYAFLSRHHPAALGTDWNIQRGTLQLCNVIGEESLFWYGDRVSGPHPEPHFPIDEVMHATFEEGKFAFDGFLKNVPWYEWFVTASGFSLLVQEATPHVD